MAPASGASAQDFEAAFGAGDTDAAIATVDGDGGALAAMRGLQAKREERETALRTQMQAKEAEIASLRSESEALRRYIADLRPGVEALMARTAGEGRVA